jgi:ribosomal-protein-alanine N-acetyltransferase
MNEEKIFKKLPEIRTKDLILRKLRISDAADIFEYASRPEASLYTIWDRHRSKKDTVAFLKYADARAKKGLPVSWAVVHKKDKRVIGTAGIEDYSPAHKCAGLGYALSPDYWNRGYTTEAVGAIIEFTYKKLGLNRVEAVCAIDNKPSARVMEKCGLKYEGILRQRIVTAKGKVHDVKIYAITAEDIRELLAEKQGRKKKNTPAQAELFK